MTERDIIYLSICVSLMITLGIILPLYGLWEMGNKEDGDD